MYRLRQQQHTRQAARPIIAHSALLGSRCCDFGVLGLGALVGSVGAVGAELGAFVVGARVGGLVGCLVGSFVLAHVGPVQGNVHSQRKLNGVVGVQVPL